MSILDFFNPKDLEHLQAYVHLNNTGVWPTGFLPDEITFPNLWQVTLAGRLAEAYLQLCLGTKNLRID